MTLRTGTEWLTLNGKVYSHADIRQGVDLDGLTEFEKDTLSFSKEWLSGSDFFNISTSGSTGAPKTISLSRRTMAASANLTAQAVGLQANHRSLVCIPTGFIGGKMMLVRSFVVGMQVTAIEPSSNPFAGLGASVRFDFAALVPLQLDKSLQAANGLNQLNSMKCILVGGAPLNPQLEKLVQKVTAPVYATYGMTETASHVALRRLNGSKPSPFFQALKGISFELDSRNCLVIHAPDLVNDPLITNDQAELLGSTRFRWLGRMDNVINSGGVKIHPEVVEKKVFEILDQNGVGCRYFVTGLPDNVLGEKIVLVLEAVELPARIQASLFEQMKASLKQHHCPRELRFVRRFRETKNGKIKRVETLADRKI